MAFNIPLSSGKINCALPEYVIQAGVFIKNDMECGWGKIALLCLKNGGWYKIHCCGVLKMVLCFENFGKIN